MPIRIVDAHHHLWDLSACHYPWLMEKGVPRFFGDPTPIQKNYLVDDLLDDFDKLSVVKSVHIQVGTAFEYDEVETNWLQAQHEAHSFPSAIVAFCDLTAQDVNRRLERHKKASAVRGIRQILGRSSKEDALTGAGSLIADPRFGEGLQHLAASGLSFDLQLVPAQMAEAAELFAQHPNLPVALCHAGSLSDFSDAGRALWEEGLRALSSLPNVMCKVSGLGMFNPSWTADSARRQFDYVADCFGPSRIAFGSNFPVDKLYMSYSRIWEHYFKLIEGFSEYEHAEMCSGTADRFYKIEVELL